MTFPGETGKVSQIGHQRQSKEMISIQALDGCASELLVLTRAWGEGLLTGAQGTQSQSQQETHQSWPRGTPCTALAPPKSSLPGDFY